MKNQKLMIPLLVVFLFLISIYKQVSDVSSNKKAYNQYLTLARQQASLGVATAIENYKNALEINPNIEISLEIADFLKKEGKQNELIKWCKKTISEYPYDSRGFECIIKAFAENEEYNKAFDYIYECEGRRIASDNIEELKKSLMYKYKLDYSKFNEVSVFINGYCACEHKEQWGYTDIFGNHVIEVAYKYVGDFTESETASVVDNEDYAYFINKENEKVLASATKYTLYGNLSNNLVPAQLPSGKYVYLDKNLERIDEKSYDYASTYNLKLAAVKNNNKWEIINTKGETIIGNLDDVYLDETEICCRNERLFVKFAGSSNWSLIDTKGEKIGNDSYNDVRLFNDDTYAAVLKNGAWRFIDKNGNDVLKKTFTGARSFSNGLAAISVADEWGFIDMEGNIVIEPAFDDAKDFTDKGSVFVKEDNYWHLLKLYSLNRE